MEQESRTRKLLTGLPFWWFSLTIIYLGLQILGENYIAALFGLFVPLGHWNFIGFLGAFVGANHPFGIIVLPLVLATLFGGDWYLHKLNMSPGLKIISVLGTLFILTAVVDFILWGNWASLMLFMNDGNVGL